MLILGRILLGVAVAFASVAVTLYNSEMAPAHIRGRLNQIFQALACSPAPRSTLHMHRCLSPCCIAACRCLSDKATSMPLLSTMAQ